MTGAAENTPSSGTLERCTGAIVDVPHRGQVPSTGQGDWEGEIWENAKETVASKKQTRERKKRVLSEINGV